MYLALMAIYGMAWGFGLAAVGITISDPVWWVIVVPASFIGGPVINSLCERAEK